MEEAHPALIGFDQTYEHDFPLILAVGREPSSHEAVVYGLGHYDFRNSPKCAFWNVSYGFVGGTIGLKTHELKSLCIARRASPLIYADALPITIKNAVANKAELRAVVLKEVITEHVAHIFSHEPVVRRIGLVLLSGLDAPQFQHSVACFQTACRERGIPAVQVPFFYGTNVPKLREAITPEVSAHIQTIMKGFREPVPPSVLSDAGGLVTAA